MSSYLYEPPNQPCKSILSGGAHAFYSLPITRASPHLTHLQIKLLCMLYREWKSFNTSYIQSMQSITKFHFNKLSFSLDIIIHKKCIFKAQTNLQVSGTDSV